MEATILDESDNISFYENRYSDNYMDEWDNEKKNRIEVLINRIKLPENGNLLDFGCGAGVFTQLLKKILPAWNIYGCDVSEHAIEKAKVKNPQCHFFNHNSKTGIQFNNFFNFIFSHHVLEHVFDIEDTIKKISNYCTINSYVFHILPCGNPHSLEYEICLLVKNGIDKVNNRFFFEDIGHLRRLSSDQLTLLHNANHFNLENQLFANQYYYGIRWMAESSKEFILNITEPKNAINNTSKDKLTKIRKKLLRTHQGFIEVKQNKSPFFLSMNHLKQAIHNPFVYMKKLYKMSLYLFIKMMSIIEWRTWKHKKNGSEMYMLYKNN